jgi:hypothetical protein
MSTIIHVFITDDEYYYYVRDNEVIISTYIEGSDLVEQGMNAVADLDFREHLTTYTSDELNEIPDEEVGRYLMSTIK